jgi:hypothetical protein
MLFASAVIYVDEHRAIRVIAGMPRGERSHQWRAPPGFDFSDQFINLHALVFAGEAGVKKFGLDDRFFQMYFLNKNKYDLEKRMDSKRQCCKSGWITSKRS